VAVAAGTVVRIDRERINRAFEAAEDPVDKTRFDPFRPTRSDLMPTYGLAFGNGAHACLGRPMVLGDVNSGPGERSDPRFGLGVAMLSEFFNAGVELDPRNPPEMYTDMARESWRSVPVRFTRPRPDKSDAREAL
jgi:hypothetical protein